MKPLNHNFKTTEGVHNLAAIVGYTKCMADILDVLKEDELFFIDKDTLRLLFHTTTKELMKLRASDEIQTTLQSLTETTNPQ